MFCHAAKFQEAIIQSLLLAVMRTHGGWGKYYFFNFSGHGIFFYTDYSDIRQI